MRSAAWLSSPLGVALLAAAMAEARADTVVLPTFNVVATSPLSGGEIDVTKVPGAVWQTGAEDIQTYNDTTVPDTLARHAPGVTVGNVSGNDFQPNVSYRGFDATPVTGAPEGLAVYQNGVRINEAFGDTVNWDLIPENAIDKMTIVAGNPIFGLNALGGALNVTMKNGFTWQGFEADLRGGSFYRAQEELQYGKQIGDYSVYMAASRSTTAAGGSTEPRRSAASTATSATGRTGLSRTCNSPRRTPSSAPRQPRRSSNCRTIGAASTPFPQTTENQMAMLAWTGAYAYSNTLSFQGGLYFRAFNQQHVKTATRPTCTPVRPYSCLNGSPVHDTLGQIIPDISQNGTLDLGEIDRIWTQSRSLGGTVQAVDTDKSFGHDNTLTVGASLDYGWTHFTGNSQLGTIENNNNTSFPVIGFPYLLDEPDSFLAPVAAKATNLYTGLYALDTFNATDRLTLTGGGRFNFAGINLEGENGALLNGYSTFLHLNPTVGLTYKITPDINFYAGYAMSNRAPTPLELGCADPNHPCIIDNFLVSDPKLQAGRRADFRGGLQRAERFRPVWQAAMVGGSLPHDARQRHPAAAEPL